MEELIVIRIYLGGEVPPDNKDKYFCIERGPLLFYQFINWSDETENRWNTVEYDTGYIGEASF